MSGPSAARNLTVLTAVLLLFALPTEALAQAPATEDHRLGGKLRGGGEVVVPEGETVDGNLYVAGGAVRVEGHIEGDLVAAGGSVDVSGVVGGDALLSGGNVRVAGEVTGSLRLAAGQARVSGTVGEDLAIAAGRARVDATAEVGDDLLFTAGRVQMEGTVAGSVVGNTGDYVETGSVAGSREIFEPEEALPPSPTEVVLDLLQRYLGIVVIGALLLWLSPGMMRRSTDSLRREPLLDVGVGAATLLATGLGVLGAVLIGALAAILLTMLGLGGIGGALVAGVLLSASVAVFVVAVLAIFGAPVVVGLWLGHLATSLRDGWARSLGALGLGALALVIVRPVPILGALVWLVVVLLGVGCLVLDAIRWRRRRRRGGVQQVPASGLQPAR